MDLNQTNEPRFTDEEMAEVDRLQSDPTSEYYYNDPDNEEGFLDKIKRKLAPYGEDFKGFVEYLFTPSRHFGTGQYNEGGVAEQMDMFGYTAEGAQQEADKFVGEAGNLEEDISKAASFIVPFYDSGVNIANVAQEYMKPEQERDYDYIKSQFTEAGQSAAIEGGLLLMGGVAGKYGAKGIKALADKVKQYEIDPTAMSAFGAGAIKKKTDKEIISVFPKPERMFPEESRPKGGDYLNPATGEVLSGRNVSSAKLSISPEGKPSFKVSNDNVEEVGSVGKGKTQIKTNLFKKKAGWKWTKAPEGMEDIATLISVENRGKHFYTIETDFSKGVNLKKYPNSKTEPRLRPTVVGEIEIGPQIGNISVRGKEHPVYQSIRTFNKGGAVMDDQMQMAFMDEGGIADDGMDVDPVSGNEVPPGSLAEEVRDDIPAQLSEGEYVVPADVVRYYGVKFFEDLRDQAKMGLADMEANGRIGGEPVPAGGPINDEELSEQEMSAIRQMMTGMAEGGEVQNPYLQQQQLYSQPRPAPIDEKRNTTLSGVNPVEGQMPIQTMASGGQVQGYQDSSVVTSTPSYAQNTFNPSQYGLGFSFMGQPQQTGTTSGDTTVVTPVTGESPMMTLYGPNGEIRTFSMPLSEADAAEVARLKEMGYSETKAVTPTPTTTGGGSGSTTQVESDPNSWMEKFDYTDMSNLGSQTSELLNKSPKGSVMGAFMNGTNAAQAAANIIIMEANGADQAEVDRLKSQYQQFLKDSKLEYMPKGLINGDRLAKDVAKSEFVNLSRDAKDPFGNPIFKDDSSFQKHTNEMRSATRSNVAQTARDTKGGVYKPGGIDVALLKKDDKSKASQAARKKSKKSSAARKSAIDRAQASMKKSGKTSVSDFRKAYEKQGGRFATGGRNKGGLMNKKGKK